VKIALLGGGGFRTPLTFSALLEIADDLDLRELALYDPDTARLRRMSQVLDGMSAAASSPLPSVTPITDLEAALTGAAFVLCAIRVGGLEGRAIDERVALAEGVVGQETAGAGGLCLVLRSTPVIAHLAETIARAAPEAWVINFTNPVGAITGILQAQLGDRVVGVCDTPSGLCRRVAGVLDHVEDALAFDYFGLNHLGWLRAIVDGCGNDLLPGILADDAALDQLEESRLFGTSYLKSLGMIPNEYLIYYTAPERLLNATASRGLTRAAYLLHNQRAFYAGDFASSAEAARAWRAARADRDGTYMTEMHLYEGGPPQAVRTAPEDDRGYAGVAAALLRSLNGGDDAPLTMILNTANRGRLSFLPDDAVVELPTRVDRHGIHRQTVAKPPGQCQTLMERVHAAERAAVEAGRSGSRAAALHALAIHPLVDSTPLAERILAGYLREHGGLQAQLT
jgi:6-phospho-beta-glucosidase